MRQIFEDRVDVEISDRPGECAEHEFLGVEDVDVHAEGLRVALAHFVPERDRVGVACADRFFEDDHVDCVGIAAGELHDHAFGFISELFGHPLCEGAPAGIRFVAAFETAVALTAVKFDDDVTEFAGAERLAAADEVVRGDDAAADSGAHGQIEEVRAASSRAEEPFREGSAVGVVFKAAVDAEFFLEVGEDRHIAPERIVGGGGHDAVGGVGGEWRRNAECGQILDFEPVFMSEPCGFGDQFREDVLGAGVDVFDPGLAEDRTGVGTESDADFGSADVEADHKFLERHEIFPVLFRFCRKKYL